MYKRLADTECHLAEAALRIAIEKSELGFTMGSLRQAKEQFNILSNECRKKNTVSQRQRPLHPHHHHHYHYHHRTLRTRPTRTSLPYLIEGARNVTQHE